MNQLLPSSSTFQCLHVETCRHGSGMFSLKEKYPVDQMNDEVVVNPCFPPCSFAGWPRCCLRDMPRGNLETAVGTWRCIGLVETQGITRHMLVALKNSAPVT